MLKTIAALHQYYQCLWPKMRHILNAVEIHACMQFVESDIKKHCNTKMSIIYRTLYILGEMVQKCELYNCNRAHWR